jgi:osmotically-inducible protein OsmY
MNGSLTPIRLLFVAVCLLSACTATPHQPSSGNYIDDFAITSRVKAALMAARLTDEGEIRVETLKGVVELDGVVDSAAAKNQAEQIASESRGVQDVDNRLSIK